MISMLYDIVVMPIVYVLESAFWFMYKVTASQGISIVGVSLVVNLLCLPLYRMADLAQEREREKQRSMERWVNHIKAHFHGDEQYMMLSTYYDQQGYHPIRALVSSLPLLLQIPFFMAAYSYLSNLPLLDGASFLFLSNLGAPDGLLVVGDLRVNVLPVVMTLINCASTMVYTRGLPLRDKLQAYILAALFLVLLYDSPSGLVFYWTCNQLFSLGKNVFMKYVPNPGKTALIVADVLVCAGAAWLLLGGRVTKPARYVAIALFVVAFLAISAWVIRRMGKGEAPVRVSAKERNAITVRFFLGGAMLAVLMGVLIPSSVVADSPTEFVDLYNFVDPLSYVTSAGCVWFGFFVFWLGIYFFLSSDSVRRKMAFVIWCLCGVCLVGYFVFLPEFGTLTTSLQYDHDVTWPVGAQLANLLVLAATACALALVWRRLPQLVTPALGILLVCVAIMSVPNIVTSRTRIDEFMASHPKDDSGLFDEDGGMRQLFTLSREGKNVVVLFMDRAMATMQPYVFDERPELAGKFDGFTYYPNTLSYGAFTNFGAPAMYGGYDYTPLRMNERDDLPLVEKHNQALKLMPTLFSQAGYATVVTDPPYANYQDVPDLSIFDGLENVKSYNLLGAYSDVVRREYGIKDVDRRRSFVLYGLFRVAPRAAQRFVYDKGHYQSTDSYSGPGPVALAPWSTLHELPALTRVTDSGDNFLLFGNTTPHEPDLYRLPDYEPARFVDKNTSVGSARTVGGRTMTLGSAEQAKAYHANITSYLQLARWFDWMREQGVYDNTRIIIVADHGRKLWLFDDMNFDEHLDLEMMNPLLMVKDFGAHGFTTDDRFMTNGDTPAIALEGIVDEPVNPYTGNPVSSEAKQGTQVVAASSKWRLADQSGNRLDTSDRPWYSVHDDVRDKSNWTRLEREPQ